MSIYLTEEEQLAAILSWFKRHQRLVVSGLLLLLSIGLAASYWSVHQAWVNERTSIAYSRLMTAVTNQDDQAVRAYAKQLSVEHASGVYRDVAHLTLARYYVARSDWTKASDELRLVSTAGHTPALKALAAMRLTRILVFEKKYQEASQQMHQLLAGPNAHYIDLAKAYELQGDIYTALGRSRTAQRAYQKAQRVAQERGIVNSLLETKLAALELAI